MKKRISVILCAALIVAALISTGTFTYYVGTQKIQNVITAGNVDFKIVEFDKNGDEVPVTGVNVLPGDTVEKTVKVENTSYHPVYVRVKVEKLVDVAGLSAEKCISMDINTTDWTYNADDGYYYYNKELLPKQLTNAIFTKVSIDGKEVDNDYLGATFSVNVSGDVVQSENNGKSVTEAVGWPDTSSKTDK